MAKDNRPWHEVTAELLVESEWPPTKTHTSGGITYQTQPLRNHKQQEAFDILRTKASELLREALREREELLAKLAEKK